MSARKVISVRRILTSGATYLDRSRRVPVTLEDHEIVGGRRAARVVVCAADGVLRLPRCWYSRDPDLVRPPRGATADHPWRHP